MPFDPYALCPGGRDKKIRFCCPNMLKEVEQVGRLLESEQTGACLSFIESLEKKHPNCACLTTAKLAIYRAENRWQEALPIAERFHTEEPDNPTAAAEYALALIVTGNPRFAVSILVDAFERSKADTIHSALLHVALQIGAYLLFSGHVAPAIAIGHVLKEIPTVAEQANEFLFRATSEAGIPIFLRDWSFDYNCPDDFPGRETFEEVTVLVRTMRWKQALFLLETKLTPYAGIIWDPSTPRTGLWAGVWHNIATLNFWLLDEKKGCEALQTYISLPNVPQEDAADAETLRLLFTPDPLGDQTHLLTIEYTITDADQALEKILSDSSFHPIEIPTQSISPPPRGCFLALNRPFPDMETALTLENVPSQLAVVLLLGKETDREARLILQSLLIDEQETLKTRIREVLGGLVQMPGNVIEQVPKSQSQILVESRYTLPPNRQLGIETVKQFFDDYHATLFIKTWSALPLGIFDGKTPVEAAKESKYTIPLLAVIHIVELWMGEEPGSVFDRNIRQRLGLPVQDTITLTGTHTESSGEDPLAALDSYPVWRWHRFDVSQLSTDFLASGLQITLGMQAMRSASRFAEELLNRPMDSMPFSVRVMAFEALITASQTHKNIEQALLWVERAKSESAAQNVPDAAWCLHEFTLRLMQNNGEAASEVLQYLVTHYRDSPAVMNSLQELFMRLGMLNPDGTASSVLAQRRQAESQAAESKLWTPDGNASAGSAGASKIWVPD